MAGETVARVVPEPRKGRSRAEVAQQLAGLDELSAEISAAWQGEPNAVATVREQRREL